MHRSLVSPLADVARPERSASARSRRAAGIAFAALGAIAFSGKAIIVKLGYRHGADATTLLALRMALAGPFFAAIAAHAATRPAAVPIAPSDRWRVAGVGFLGYYLASYLDFAGLAYVSASLERLILYLNPTIVVVIGATFLGQRVTGRQLVALALGYAGVGLALFHDFRVGGSDIALGSALVFASALSYAVYLVGSGALLARVGTLRLTAYASCVASAFCMLQFIVTRPLALLAELPAPVWWLSLLNATACTVVPVFCVMLGVRRLGASVASQIGMIGPISTIILAAVLLDERLGALQVAGTVLVVAAIFIVSHDRRAAPSPNDRPVLNAKESR